MANEVRHLPFSEAFDAVSGRWCVVGKDVAGEDFGIGVGRTMEAARRRLRDWVEEVLALDGGRAWADLRAGAGAGEVLVFKRSVH
jgi:hypothetical protein